MDCNVVIEGDVKFRDGRKWKSRWCMMRKLSPVADCLHLQLYRDSKDRYKQGMTKASLSLEHFLGVETGFTTDKESNTIAIICRDVTVILAFESRERLIQWQMKISYNLGESTQFLVQISNSPAKTKLQYGPAKLHIQNHNFCLTSGIPPKLIGYWEMKHLRRYGVVDGKFCFEGGSLCGKGEGLYIFLTDECEEISWNMHMASEGRLIPKRRFTARNMSVVESPSRRYIQRPSDSNISTLCDTNTKNSQNGSYRSFGNIYEWPSMDLTHDNDLDEKALSGDYNFSPPFPETKSLWTELDFQKFADRLHLCNINLEEQNSATKCDSSVEVISAECYADMSQTKSLKIEKRSHGDNQPPERPPKPAKYKSSQEFENSVIVTKTISSSKTNCCTGENTKFSSTEDLNDFNRRLVGNEVDNYDVPKTLFSTVDSKGGEHKCVCTECENFSKTKEFSGMDNYDIPPIAVPVPLSCSCVEKKRLIIESEEYYKMNVCPCQRFITCWPYNWFQLAYCRKGNTIQDTTSQLHLVSRATMALKSETNTSSLYAKVDLSKKTKRKPKETDVEVAVNTSAEVGSQLQAICDPNANDAYANLFFENSLKFYENARELVRSSCMSKDNNDDCRTSNLIHQQNCSPSHFCAKCGHTKNVPKTFDGVASGDQANYLIMNPIGLEPNDSTVQNATAALFGANSQLSKSMDKFTVLNRCRSDSTSSAKSVPATFHFHKQLQPQQQQPLSTVFGGHNQHCPLRAENEDLQLDNEESRSSCSSNKPNGNRDSSGSNDSGFSFGSLKLQGTESGDVSYQPSSMTSTTFVIGSRTGSPKSVCLKSSDPMKDIAFQFHGTVPLVAYGDIPACHKRISSKDSSGSRSETGSSIPYIDSQSTSSETSDISDYIETLSLSSHSSSDTTSNAKLLHPAASVLRPRSGKEYEKVTRVLWHCGSGKQEKCNEN